VGTAHHTIWGMEEILALIIGLAIGGVAVWLILRAREQSGQAVLAERLASREQIIQSQTDRLAAMENLSKQVAAAEERNKRIPQLESELAKKDQELRFVQNVVTNLKAGESELRTTIEQERKAADAKLALLNDAQQKLSDAFKALSSDALKSNNQSFLELANATLEKFQQAAKIDLAARQQEIGKLVEPLKLSLEKVDGQITAIESKRTEAYATLTEQVRSLLSTEGQLRAETANLVKALRAPQVRGRWGEVQLKRVVELAGMIEHCDFQTQVSVATEDGALRPDLVVRLPGGRNIVVDAKCPLEAYIAAVESSDETMRAVQLKRHAGQLRKHIADLGEKSYWEQFRPAPEFVFLFLPGEAFYSAALEQDPSLLESGVNKRVIIATPTTLIALLKAVAYGWRQEQVEKNAQEISKLGRELYDRLRLLAEHFAGVGGNLDRAVDSYNKAIGTLETRVFVTARKFKELGAGADKEIAPPDEIDKKTRLVQAPELAGLPGPTQSLDLPSANE